MGRLYSSGQQNEQIVGGRLYRNAPELFSFDNDEYEKQKKRERYAEEARIANEEAKKANNRWEVKLARGASAVKNTAINIGGAMIESPKKLGTYGGQAYYDIRYKRKEDARDQKIAQNQLSKYREKYQKGELSDVSYQKIMKTLSGESARKVQEAKEYGKSLPTTKQIIKAGAGTALDIATAGQFSRAKAGMSTLKLAKGAKAAQIADKATKGAKAIKVAKEIVAGAAIGGTYNALNELDEDQMTAGGAWEKFKEGAVTGGLFTGALKGAGKVAKSVSDRFANTKAGKEAMSRIGRQEKVKQLLQVADDNTMPQGGQKTIRNAKIASLLDETGKVTSQMERNETVKNLLALKTDVQKHLDEYNGMLSDYSLKGERKAIQSEIKTAKKDLASIDNKIATLGNSQTAEVPKMADNIHPTQMTKVGEVGQGVKSTLSKAGMERPIEVPKEIVAEPTLGTSKVFERVKNKLGEEFKDDAVTYQKISLEDDAKKAVDLMNTDRQRALQIAKGTRKVPEGQTETAISIALAEDAAEKGDWGLYRELVEKRSLRQTRRGQEIVSEKGSIHQGADYYMKKVLNERINKVGKTGVSLTGKETPSAKLTATVEREAKKASEILNSSRLKIEDAQKLLDDLTCR